MLKNLLLFSGVSFFSLSIMLAFEIVLHPSSDTLNQTMAGSVFSSYNKAFLNIEADTKSYFSQVQNFMDTGSSSNDDKSSVYLNV